MIAFQRKGKNGWLGFKKLDGIRLCLGVGGALHAYYLEVSLLLKPKLEFTFLFLALYLCQTNIRNVVEKKPFITSNGY